MSFVKRIICLANSWKLKERCIAGIDIDTGKWVRPVCDSLYPEDGKVPESIRLINGKEPQSLDILEIPLSNTGNNFEFESENLSILSGNWKLIGKALPYDLTKFCSTSHYILHNSGKFVNPSYLKDLPFEQRQTLQLVKSSKFTTTKTGSSWKGSIQLSNGQFLEKLTITDPFLVHKLDEGYQPPHSCFIVISLSMPWSPHEDWEGESPCWKLIAGVIPDLFPSIDVEIKRVGWSEDQGRDFIERKFGCEERSRRKLYLNELQEFLDHLKSLPSRHSNFDDDFV